MWIILIIAALGVFLWLTEPKPEQSPVRSRETPERSPESNFHAGGINRFLDR
ncbi:hypothetical protein Dform_01929 [Dehalogenimonas formicexedens]|uniref:Uncharacterized protein n=1 Tax=Dehalogenimonas formicexedens TaxID=1839801 RepID=A0A1P8F9V8_9CHLR|nr:hypothetical protein [Dehalogenimonas formicexedens]APV45244.1 hypothetical protein Dform_01929 [Dehalogenimonas formicexedens]